MNQQIIINSLEELQAAADTFIKSTQKALLFAFTGTMGAGKTTFIKAICDSLGVTQDVVNSPSFSIVNEYNTDGGDVIYHFDFYRIKTPDEAFDIGFEDYLYSNNRCFIEWPDKVAPLLPDDIITVNIKVNNDNSRIISWS